MVALKMPNSLSLFTSSPGYLSCFSRSCATGITSRSTKRRTSATTICFSVSDVVSKYFSLPAERCSVLFIHRLTGMLQDKVLKGTSCSRKIFILQMHQPPLPHDRKTFDIKNDQPIGLQLHIERHPRDQRNAQPGRDSLLDSTIIPHLHAYLQGEARLLKCAFERATRT